MTWNKSSDITLSHAAPKYSWHSDISAVSMNTNNHLTYVKKMAAKHKATFLVWKPGNWYFICQMFRYTSPSEFCQYMIKNVQRPGYTLPYQLSCIWTLLTVPRNTRGGRGGGDTSYGVSRVNPLGNLNGSFTLAYFSSHQRLSTVCSTFNPLLA